MRFALPGLLLVAAASPALACLWDYDTLEMERQRFPGVMEVIAGKVLRHSNAWYAWRVEDRQRRLANDPHNLALLDDLAVALDKLGRHEDAIAAARRAEALDPRRYETLANLGTLLVHAGQLEAGLPYLKRAVEINPQAHFGRERYQIALIEYVLERRAGPRPGPGSSLQLPLQLSEDELCFQWDDPSSSIRAPRMRGEGAVDFVGFLRREGAPLDLPAAVKGVCGMAVFGQLDSPVLLEALGDLLRAHALGEGGEQLLAARAYLKAARQVDGAARAAYRALARGVLETQWATQLEQIEAALEPELAEGQAWLAAIAADEQAWIAAGQDPEAAFAAKYYADPELGGPAWQRALLDLPGRVSRYGALVGGAIALAVLAWLRSWSKRRRAARREPDPAGT